MSFVHFYNLSQGYIRCGSKGIIIIQIGDSPMRPSFSDIRRMCILHLLIQGGRTPDSFNKPYEDVFFKRIDRVNKLVHHLI